MSARLLGLAFDAEAPSASAKLVLIKLVDCCDDEGRKIFPAVATLARAAQCDARTVHRHIALFCSVGLLRRVREGGHGRGSTSHYEMSIEVLRRIAAKGWAAVAGAAAAGDDAASHAETAEASAPDDAAKGDTMSPLNEADAGDRVTRETVKGDTRVIQPLKNNPQGEREGACGPAKAGASAKTSGHAETTGHAETAGEAMGDMPRLEAFVSGWPTRAVDDQARVASAWGELTLAERRAALAGVAPFLAEMERTKRKHCPAGWKYLSEKRWTLLADMRKAGEATETVNVRPFSKGWWALFHRARGGGGGNARLLLQVADQGRGWAVRAGDLDAARPEVLKAMPAHGDAGAAFLASARRAGFHFPNFGREAWIFLLEADLAGATGDDLQKAGGV